MPQLFWNDYSHVNKAQLILTRTEHGYRQINRNTVREREKRGRDFKVASCN